MVGNPEAVSFVYTVGGIVFLMGLFAGFIRTAVRVITVPPSAYPGGRRPRLLIRDVIVIGGFALTMTAITLIRFLPPEVRVAYTQGNVWWALLTTIPICVSVLVYCFYEYAVIERRPK